MQQKMTTLSDFDEWLRLRVRAKAMISDQVLNRGSVNSTPRQTNGRRNGHNRHPRANGVKAELSTFATTVSTNQQSMPRD